MIAVVINGEKETWDAMVPKSPRNTPVQCDEFASRNKVIKRKFGLYFGNPPVSREVTHDIHFPC